MTPKEQYEARRKAKRAMSLLQECCHNCRYHAMNPQDMKTVACRRYPPQQFMVQQQGKLGFMLQYPMIAISWWCGEYHSQNEKILDLETHSSLQLDLKPDRVGGETA